jgi:hypothetical protein
MRITCLAAVALLAPAFAAAAPPLNCGTITQSGSYTLTRNLSSTGDCIVVASDFVTIDLAGFTISGTDNPQSVGIREGSGGTAPGFRGVVIRNGNIVHFGQGIDFELSPGVTIEHVNASQNVFNGATLLGNTSVVRSSRFDNNGGGGIGVEFNSVLADNIAIGNGASGFFAAEGSLIVNNQATSNGTSGIAMECPSAAIANSTNENVLGPNLEQINAGSCLLDRNLTF